MSIEVRGVTKIFGSTTVLHDIDLEVGSGELVALLGPSGCGKTTLLRVIAGLEADGIGLGRRDGGVRHRAPTATTTTDRAPQTTELAVARVTVTGREA